MATSIDLKGYKQIEPKTEQDMNPHNEDLNKLIQAWHLNLGFCLGAIHRDEIVEYLAASDVSRADIELFKQTALKLGAAAYYERKKGGSET